VNHDDFATQFLSNFVVPWLEGGTVWASAPFLERGVEMLPRVTETRPARALTEVVRTKGSALGIDDIDGEMDANERLFAEDLLPLLALHDVLFLCRPEGQSLSKEKQAGLRKWVRFLFRKAAASLSPSSDEVSRSVLARVFLRSVLLRPVWSLPLPNGKSFADWLATLPSVPSSSDGSQSSLLSELQKASPLFALLAPPPHVLELSFAIPWLRFPSIARAFVVGQLRFGAQNALGRVGDAVSSLLPPKQQGTSLERSLLETLLAVFSLFHVRVAIAENPQTFAASDSSLLQSQALFSELWMGFPQYVLPPGGFRLGDDTQRVFRYLSTCRERSDRVLLETLRNKLHEALSSPSLRETST